MRILILSEFRSGSTSLLNWFNLSDNYSIVFQPITNPKYISKKKSTKDLIYTDIRNIDSYQYSTKNIVIKEVTPIDEHELINLLQKVDKVIVLFREDYENQLKSFLFASNTNIWESSYIYDTKYILNKEHLLLDNSKSQIEKYKSKYFSISYEDLYYREKIQKLIDYIGDGGLTSISFPYGTKYRLEKNNKII
jgi:hypothetical protein